MSLYIKKTHERSGKVTQKLYDGMCAIHNWALKVKLQTPHTPQFRHMAPSYF